MTERVVKLSVVGTGDSRRLRVIGPDASVLQAFDGHAAEGLGGSVLEGPLSARNAELIRNLEPSLRPQPLGLQTSAGVGDRLGLATPGHARAFARHGTGVAPVFAQQSIREMDRLGRRPQNVLDDATFGCLQAGWHEPFGADADHLKSTADIDRCLHAGFTLYTLDPGDNVVNVGDAVTAKQFEAVPWHALEDNANSMVRRYQSGQVDLGDHHLVLHDNELRRAAVKYGSAIARVLDMYRHLMSRATHPVEVEIAVDETDEVTTLVEHVYLATELKRLGISFVGFAPRYLDGFEKGVDYLGDPDELERSLREHAAIARALGPYKLSLHSGSDKFSIYARAAEATDRLVHLKTSGTSYLVALGVVSRSDAALFREIYQLSREAYRASRASYQVSANLDRVPELDTVVDVQLPSLVEAFDSRQMLHVGYAAALRTPDGEESGPSQRLRDLLSRSDEYTIALEEHLGRHLQPFSMREAS